MVSVNRRKFIEKFLIGNASMLMGAGWLMSCSEDTLLALKNKELDFLPIQADNIALTHWINKCEKCGDCIEACAEKQKVFGTYEASKTKHVCIHCGTCLLECEEGAITEKYNWKDVLKAIGDPSKIVIASIAPSVRVGIGDFFGADKGSFLKENLVGACRKVGFDYVLDTNFSADLTIIEEAFELQNRLQQKLNVPQFTSCCPAWVKYVEIYYPELLNHLSTVKSPISMQGALVKTYFAQKNAIDPKNIIHVAIAPCTAKKYEITREELSTNEMRSNDYVLTTSELAILLKDQNIDITAQSSNYDTLMGVASGGGILFGNSGGVMQAAIRTAYFNILRTNPPDNLIALQQIQGLTGFKEATVQIGSTTLNVAVCYEIRNAKPILEQLMNGTSKYDFVEVMACKGGCIGGAGQPAKESTLALRIDALNNADKYAATRFCHENSEVNALYNDFLGNISGPIAKKYLHTGYSNKASLLL
jgi:ferredoxin hydrogenase